MRQAWRKIFRTDENAMAKEPSHDEKVERMRADMESKRTRRFISHTVVPFIRPDGKWDTRYVKGGWFAKGAKA